MNIDDFNKLKKIVSEELVINEDNISKKSIQLSTYFQRYCDIYSKELRILKGIGVSRETLYGKLYHKYKFGSEYSLDTKTEIDIYVRSDDDYSNKCLEYQNQEVIVKHLELILDNINKAGYMIKNWIDIQKLKHGIT